MSGAVLDESGRKLFRSGHAYGEIRATLSGLQPKGLCLDLPSGEGANLAGIADAGFTPVAADLFPSSDGGIAVRSDWNSPLPFADESFAAVLCSEGIEHHQAQTEFLFELSRVLRPDGALLITTPNVLSLSARLSNLFNGHYTHRRSPISELTQIWSDAPGRSPYVGHVHMVGYFALRFMLWRAGLRIEAVSTARYANNAIVLAPLLWLPVHIGTRRVLREVKPIKAEVYREMVRHVTSPALLFGKKMIVLARKDPSSNGHCR